MAFTKASARRSSIRPGTGPLCCSLTNLHEFSECREPCRKTLLLEMIDPTITFLRGAVECCPPFDESRIALDDRRNVDCRDVVAVPERGEDRKVRTCRSDRGRNERAGSGG